MCPHTSLPSATKDRCGPDHAHWCPYGPRTAFSSPLTMSGNTGCGRRHVLQVSGDWWGQLDKGSSTCGPETGSGKQRDWPTHLQPLLWQFHMDQTVLIHTTSLLPKGFNQADKRAQTPKHYHCCQMMTNFLNCCYWNQIHHQQAITFLLFLSNSALKQEQSTICLVLGWYSKIS